MLSLRIWAKYLLISASTMFGACPSSIQTRHNPRETFLLCCCTLFYVRALDIFIPLVLIASVSETILSGAFLGTKARGEVLESFGMEECRIMHVLQYVISNTVIQQRTGKLKAYEKTLLPYVNYLQAYTRIVLLILCWLYRALDCLSWTKSRVTGNFLLHFPSD